MVRRSGMVTVTVPSISTRRFRNPLFAGCSPPGPELDVSCGCARLPIRWAPSERRSAWRATSSEGRGPRLPSTRSGRSAAAIDSGSPSRRGRRQGHDRRTPDPKAKTPMIPSKAGMSDQRQSGPEHSACRRDSGCLRASDRPPLRSIPASNRISRPAARRPFAKKAPEVRLPCR